MPLVLEEKHATSLREIGQLRQKLAENATTMGNMKYKADKSQESTASDLRKALDAVSERDATISALQQTLTTERRERLQDSMRVQQQQQQQKMLQEQTPRYRPPLTATPSSSVPRARVRIHRSGSIVIKNDQTADNSGTRWNSTIIGGGDDTISQMSSPGTGEEVVKLRVEVSLLQEEKRKLESDNRSLKARLSLQESFASTSQRSLQGPLLGDSKRHSSESAAGASTTAGRGPAHVRAGTRAGGIFGRGFEVSR